MELVLTVIPAVNLNATTALQQSASVRFGGRFSIELMSLQVGVVGGVDEVVR